MQPSDDYNYETAGFDSFLSRSIDGIPQTNLDSLGPISREVGYDRSQFSGSTSDTIRIGQTKVDASGVKVANEGQDVTSARDDQLAFDSSRSNFYIVKTIPYTWTPLIDATSLQAGVTIAHSLGYAPDKVEGNCVPNFQNNGREYNLPVHLFDADTSYYDKFGAASIVVDGYDMNFIYIRLITQGIHGFSWAAAQAKSGIKFKLYCLKTN